MGARRITPEQWRDFDALIAGGYSIAEAQRKVGISYSAAKQRVRGVGSDGAERRLARVELELPAPLTRDVLCEDARRALDDFGYFRARYLGRLSTPWQEDAAYRLLGWLRSPRKEYAVVNSPPGGGKSTLFTLDIPLWLTCLMRAIRGMIGSASQTLAERYVVNLRNVLESPYRFESELELIERGLAVDAVATLSEDFGFFKAPGRAALWNNQAFTVAQLGNRPLTHKEPTWSGYGLDSKVIGGRYDFIVLDDLIDDSHVRTQEQIDKHRGQFDRVIEKRLEPAGLLVVNGQRLSPEDIYRYLIDKSAGDADERVHELCCSNEDGRKYHLIRFRAHDETKCVGVHGEEAPYWPDGCQLDPRRLPWRELSAEQANGMSNYLTVYQQEDADPDQMLVNPLWISGGTDPVSGEQFVGCWDNDRGLCEPPPQATRRLLSVASIDPSPTQFYGITWWLIDTSPDVDCRYLMDLERRKMSSADVLDWNNPDGVYTGLMEDWQQRSVELGHPITHWVYEANAAQRDFLTGERFNNWKRSRQVSVLPHQTSKTKQDPKFGVQRLAPLYRFGKVRLPGARFDEARTKSLKLIDEVQKYPMGRLFDLGMSQWFVEVKLPTITPAVRKSPKVPVPGYVAKLPRRAAALSRSA